MGGAGARGVRVRLRFPPGVAVPSGRGGTSPRVRGGGGPALLRLAGRGGSVGGGEGGPLRCSPPLWPVGWPVAPAPVILCLRRAPPGYTCAFGGCRAAVGVRRGPVGPQWVSVAGGGEGRGGGDLLALVRAPALPRPASVRAAPFAPSLVPPFRCRSVAANAGVCGRSTGGACRAAALAAAAVPPPLGAAAPLGGCRAAVSPAGLRPLLGRGGGEGGGGLVT